MTDSPENARKEFYSQIHDVVKFHDISRHGHYIDILYSEETSRRDTVPGFIEGRKK